MEQHFCTKKQLAELTGLSSSTVKKYRLQGFWVEGLHWQRVNSRFVLYNLPLVLDWIANRFQPEQHQQTIEQYVRSLPSNKSKQRKTSL